MDSISMRAATSEGLPPYFNIDPDLAYAEMGDLPTAVLPALRELAHGESESLAAIQYQILTS